MRNSHLKFLCKVNLLAMIPFMLLFVFACASFATDSGHVATDSTIAVLGAVGIGFGARKHLRLDPNAGGGNGNESVLLEKIKSLMGTTLAEKDAALKTELEQIRTELKAASTQTEVNEVKKRFDELAASIESKMEKANKSAQAQKTLRDQVTEQVAAKADQLKSLMNSEGSNAKVKIEVKAAATMTTGNVTPVGTGGLSMLLNDYEPGLTPIPRQAPFFADLMSSAPTTGNTVSYAEMKNPDGGAGMTAEGAAKTQADFDIIEAKATVRKITSYIKVSKEALDDIPQIAAEINGELNTLIRLKLDNQLMTGDNTGQNLNGVITQATAYSAGSFAATIPTANYFDVLTTACTQVKTAEVISGTPAGFMPTHIIVHSNDFVKMKLTKDTHGQYLFPINFPGVSQVINIPIVENPWMTEGEFLVGDFSKANLRIREGITFAIGYENDDFTKNLVTILAEMRVAFYIKSNHAKAFVTGNFDDAVAALLST